MNIFYFGCWNTPGHFLVKPGGTHVHKAGPFDAGRIDGFFTPASEADLTATITHVKGWTIMAMWDRSVDKRSGSNCAFVMEGIHGASAMWIAAQENFPNITARLTLNREPKP